MIMHILSGFRVLMAGSVLLIIVLIFFSGCIKPSTPAIPPTPVYTPQTTILIGSADVNPQILVISRGVTITWLNLDMGIHTISSDIGDPDSFTSPPLANSNRFQFTFTIPGTYGYHCSDNRLIKGTIIVHP